MTKLKLLLMAMLVFCAGVAWSQTRTITGTILTEAGAPVPNATIVVKGSNDGTTSNADGNFSINVPMGNAILVISAVGLGEKEVIVGDAHDYLITLSSSASSLDEVVVVAYGKQTKSKLIGTVSTVNAEQLRKQQITSVTQGLQGLATGAVLFNTSGQPGSNPAIYLRGIGSFSASQQPLIVVDGVPFAGNINTISPTDIESMSVLTDATATSLYGSRAANGVILLTTKKGAEGRAQINAYATYGRSKRAVKEYEYVSTEQYMKLAWEAQKNWATYDAATKPDNPNQFATDNLILGTANGFGLFYNPYNVANPIDANGNLVSGAELLWNSDWVDAATNPNIDRKNVGINFSGGGKDYKYYMSADYLSQDGVVRNSTFDRVTVRINGDANLRSWLKVGLNSSVASSYAWNPNQSGSAFANSVQFARIVSSIYPIYMRDNDGNLKYDDAGAPMFDYGGPLTGQTFNQNRPVAQNMNAIGLLNLDKVTSNNHQITTNAYGEITFIPELKFRSQYGIERYFSSNLSYANPLFGDASNIQGRVRRDRGYITTYTWNNMLTYDKTFGPHTIGAMASTEAFAFLTQSLSAGTTGFPGSGLEEVGPGAVKETATSSTNERRITSYFGRVKYDYDNRYLFEGSVRRDGSTRFSVDNRWGTFYSAGLAWNLGNESFIKNLDVFSTLKLRYSIGEVGNEGLTSFFPYLTLYNSGWNDLAYPGVNLGELGNPSVTWEKQTMSNYALDFGFFKDRLTGTLAYYNRYTYGLLFDRPLPASSGVSSIVENVGAVRNTGLEFTLNARIVNSSNFKWSANFNIASNKNEVVRLPQEFIISGSKRLEVGRGLYDFWIWEWAGVDPETGLGQWWADDPDNPGESIKVNGTANARRSYQGTSLPKIVGGFSNNFEYKGFDLSFIFNYALGHKILDSDWIGMMNGFSAMGRTLSVDILDRWQQPGDVTDVPRLKYGNNDYGNASTRHLFKADYLRLRNFTLGYTLPTSLFGSKKVVSNARVFIQGDNMFTYAPGLRPGADPEGPGITGLTGQSSTIFKTFSAGVNISF